MPKLDESLDPVVVAALMDDPTDEEAKKITKEATDAAAEEDDDTNDAGASNDDAASDGEDEDKEVDVDKDKKPAIDPEKDKDDQLDDNLTDAEKEEAERQTRKEKRELRKQNFLKKVHGGQQPRNLRAEVLKGDPSYKPLDYDAADAFKPEELSADRNKFGHNQFVRGAEVERHIAQQENFWTGVEYQAKLLQHDPKYQFLNEDNKDEFNPDRATELTEMYLDFIGFKAEPVKNAQNQHIVGTDGQPAYRMTAERTDLPYDEFVKGYIETMEDFADDREFANSSKIAAQKSKQGVRPSGSRKGNSIGKLKPGDIAGMSNEDFEENEVEIDRQIAQELGM